MTIEQYFQPQRFISLLKVEISKINRTTWMIIAAVTGILLLASMSWAGDHDPEFHEDAYTFLLLAGGFLFTSYAFKELIHPQSRQFYLSLPASHFEKFAVKLLITSIGYATFVLVFYWLFSFMIDGLTAYYFDYSFPAFQPFSSELWFIFRLYLVLQAVFLLGAVAFRKYAFFKTVLATIVIPFVFAILSFIILRIVFIDIFGFDANMEGGMNAQLQPNKNLEYLAKNILWPFAKFILWIGVPVFLWVVTYFKLTEKEA